MGHLSAKIKLIFFPFLLISVGFIICYTLLNWLLFIKLNIFPVQEEVINFFLPFGLPWIPILIWLAPRTRLIPLKNGSDKPRFGVQFLATVAIFFPTFFLQMYMETATGRLTKLENINGIDKQEPTKYYSLQRCYIDKADAGAYFSSRVSGKNNEDLHYEIHYALPILNDTIDTARQNCAAWLGVTYHKTISNGLKETEKDEKWKGFVSESEQDFNEKNAKEFVYLRQAGNDDDHKRYLLALKQSPKFNETNKLILLGVNEPFEARNGQTLLWAIVSFGGGALLFLFTLLLIKIDDEELKKRLEGHPTGSKEAREFLKYFIPHKGFFVTAIIMDLNILVFALMVFNGLGFVDFMASDLKVWGANYKPLTTNGEWWRLLTSAFVHGGAMHLFMNMATLLLVGIVLEPTLGRMKFTIAYLLTGILASVTSMYWHGDVVSVGASGAIFGMYGVFLALLLTGIFPKEFSKPFMIFTLIFIGYNLLLGLKGSVDNAAHIGGLLSGIVLGFIMYPTLKRQTMDDLKELEQEQIRDAYKDSQD